MMIIKSLSDDKQLLFSTSTVAKAPRAFQTKRITLQGSGFSSFESLLKVHLIYTKTIKKHSNNGSFHAPNTVVKIESIN